MFVLLGVFYYYEWIDGVGYFLGFKGDEILWMGRLIVVVDVFDVMMMNCFYCDVRIVEEVVGIFYEGVG